MPFRVPAMVVIGLLIAGSLKAQLQANFTASATGGCTPLEVTFTNTSTGASGSAQYTWTFGNGNGVGPSAFTSTVSAVYSTPQTYTATLTVTDGGNTSTKSVSITVYPKPTVNFTYTGNTGCIPLTANFSSTSAPGAGSITNYFWDFGDGNTLSTTNASASNLYNFAGTYSPNLTVTNSFGCTNSLTLSNIVTVYPPVQANFTADSTTLCNIKDPVQFTNTSTGPGTLTYLWNFGDGTTSTLASPSHVYTAKGVYTVTLTTTSDKGCTSTTVKTELINVADFNPSFSIPLNTCSNTPALFTDQTNPPGTGTPTWSFSDGGSASGSPVTHDFTAPGTYQVTLTETFGACKTTLTQPVTVKSGVNLNGFVMVVDSVCGAPALVTFADTSKGSVKWSWSFTGSATDTSTAKSTSFTYGSNGTYNPTLTVTDANGCSGTVSEPLSIQPPNVTISDVPTTSPSDSVCAIISALFSATSTDTLTQYYWTFGDGTSATSANPTHVYSDSGTYNITLNYVTNHGCRGQSNSLTIIVYPKPHAAFMSPDTLICGNTAIPFQNQSTGNASTYTWNYGNGVTLVNDANPAYYAYGDSGTYTITLVASNPGCADTTTRVNYIHVLPPFPRIKVLNTCDSTRNEVTLIDSAIDATSGTWSFGDGTPLTAITANDTIEHDYSKSGAYTVVLTATNGACTLTDTAQVYVLLKQSPELTSTLSVICAGTSLPYKLSGLDTNYESVSIGSTTYYNINTWQYGDSTSFGSAGAGLSVQYSGSIGGLTSGKDSVRVITKSAYFGCYDTSNYIPLKIMGPQPAFSITDDMCYKTPVIFSDSTKEVDSIPITQWVWQFGDDSTVTHAYGDTVMHRYAAPGTYTATLTVTDSLGCKASTSVTGGVVTVNGPQANFYWTPTDIIPGTTATFINSSTQAGGATYQWYFQSNGATSSNATSVNHYYANSLIDSVRLIATGTGGGACIDTITKAVPVETLNASFTYTSSYINSSNCPPMVAYFISNTFAADSLVWNFGDGGTADNNPKPSHTYLEPGVYLVTLTAYGAGGTNIVSTDSVTVKGPYATLSTNLLQACIPQAVILTAGNTHYASSFSWDFGDGTVLSSSDTTQTHTYILPGVYSPALILTDSTGCQATFKPQNSILMDTLHVSMGPTLKYCDSSLVLFQPDVLSFVVDSLHQTLTYHWAFGTGAAADTANIPQPGFDYTQPGTYIAQVQVSSIPGCTATAQDTVVVSSTATGSIAGPLTACAGDSLQYKGTANVFGHSGGTIAYSWSFTGGDTSTLTQPPLQVLPIGSDTVRLILSMNGCADTTKAPLTVYPYPVLNPVVSKNLLCLGDSAQLWVNPGPAYTWTPSTGLSNDTSSHPVVIPSANTTYLISGTLNGCTTLDSVKLTVVPRINLASSSDTAICQGTSVQITAQGAAVYQWSPMGSLSKVNGGSALASPDITTDYMVVGWDAYRCFADTNHILVKVTPYPTITFPENTVTVPSGQSFMFNPDISSDASTYSWTPADGLSCTDCANPLAIPYDPGTYTLTVTTAYGCTASATVSVQLLCRQDAVHVPSAFTPNHDGHNDLFYPMGRGIKTIDHFNVYDRWGRPVYSRDNMPINDATTGWDGTYAGHDMPPDAYVYIMEITCDTGETFQLKGTVVLIR
jgi:gliding motility-associated-like protein